MHQACYPYNLHSSVNIINDVLALYKWENQDYKLWLRGRTFMVELLHPNEFYYKPQMYSFPWKITSWWRVLPLTEMFMWPKYYCLNSLEKNRNNSFQLLQIENGKLREVTSHWYDFKGFCPINIYTNYSYIVVFDYNVIWILW